ncbi:MAG: hypothetical protein LBJ87_15815 [bacterium]|nr:hypothetical protein [bacterium]
MVSDDQQRVEDRRNVYGTKFDVFCHWRWVGPPPKTNPLRQQMSSVRGLDQAVGLALEPSGPILVWLDLSPRRRPPPAGLSEP